jgi:hypothetical protein
MDRIHVRRIGLKAGSCEICNETFWFNKVRENFFLGEDVLAS